MNNPQRDRIIFLFLIISVALILMSGCASRKKTFEKEKTATKDVPVKAPGSNFGDKSMKLRLLYPDCFTGTGIVCSSDSTIAKRASIEDARADIGHSIAVEIFDLRESVIESNNNEIIENIDELIIITSDLFLPNSKCYVVELNPLDNGTYEAVALARIGREDYFNSLLFTYSKLFSPKLKEVFYDMLIKPDSALKVIHEADYSINPVEIIRKVDENKP